MAVRLVKPIATNIGVDGRLCVGTVSVFVWVVACDWCVLPDGFNVDQLSIQSIGGGLVAKE